MSNNSPVTTKLTLALSLTNKDGVSETPESLAQWVTSCLNCNTNRVEVQVETLLAQPVKAVPAGSPVEFTPAQMVLLRYICGGEFVHLLEMQSNEALQASLSVSGNLLLQYLMKDLSVGESGGGLEEAVVALEAAIHDIGVIRDAMLRTANS